MPGVPRTISPLSFFFFSADGLTVTLRPSEIRSKEWTWKYTKELDSIVVYKLHGWNSLHALGLLWLKCVHFALLNHKLLTQLTDATCPDPSAEPY